MPLFKNRMIYPMDYYYSIEQEQQSINYSFPTEFNNANSKLQSFLESNNVKVKSVFNHIFNNTVEALLPSINSLLTNSGIDLALTSTKEQSQSSQNSSLKNQSSGSDTSTSSSEQSQNNKSGKQSSSGQSSFWKKIIKTIQQKNSSSKQSNKK